MKLKNRHWYNRGEKFWRFKFDIKVVIGAADLKFQLLTKDKRVINEDHDSIEVTWQPATEPPPASEKETLPVYSVPA